MLAIGRVGYKITYPRSIPDFLDQWHVGVKDVTVQDLLRELYERGCERTRNGTLWWLVRHTAGLLRRYAADLGRKRNKTMAYK